MSRNLLVLESAMEEQGLVSDAEQRRQRVLLEEVFRTHGLRVMHERVHSLKDIQYWLERCARHNRARIRRKAHEHIEFIHIGAHGTRNGLTLPNGDDEVTLEEAFSPLQSARVRMILLSSCKLAGGRLAPIILESSGAQYLVGYPNNTYDDICNVAEPMLYHQLITRPKTPVNLAVRRVNDMLALMRYPSRRHLVCWRAGDDQPLDVASVIPETENVLRRVAQRLTRDGSPIGRELGCSARKLAADLRPPLKRSRA